MVNGFGPSGESTHGQGYGAGGGTFVNISFGAGDQEGYAGVIILELMQNP